MDADDHERRTLPVIDLRARAVELSDRNWQAYQHYLECRAVGQWPDDPIVRRHAAIIRAELDAFERQQLQRPVYELAALLAAGRKK